MASSFTERPAFLHWKRAVPPSKSKPREAGQRVRVKVEETRKKLAPFEDKVGVSNVNKSPPVVDRPSNGLAAATLRDLCPQDKARVRGLVEQLAAVGEEREQLASAIAEDRAHFIQLLDKLKSEHNKVLSEKDKITEELLSSQLQLQQLHTITPHTPPRPRTTSHASHMTTAAASNHSPPPDKTTTSKTTSSQSFPNQATATKTKVDNCSSPKPCSTIEGHRDNTNERGRKELTPHSERGGKELTSHSDDWRTLSPTSPTPPPKHHMTSQTGHMTPETDHMTSQTGHMIQKTDHMTPATGHTTPANGHMTPVTDHMTSKGASGWTTPPTRASPVVPIPTPPHLRDTPTPKSTPPHTIQSSTASQTDLLDISDVAPLVTMETRSPPPVKRGQSSIPLLPNRPKQVLPLVNKSPQTGKKFSPKIASPIAKKGRSPNAKKRQSKKAIATTSVSMASSPNTVGAKSDDDTLTRSMLEQSTPTKSAAVGTRSTSSDITSNTTSRAHNESVLTPEMESLLATALLNARETLNTIQTFTQSLGSGHSSKTALSSTSYQSDNNPTDVVSAQTSRLKLSGVGASKCVSKRQDVLESPGVFTSTPYVGCGGNGMLSHSLESPLDSTAIEWDDELSEILEHAHTLSQLSRTSNHGNSSNQSERPDNDDNDILDELFFI